MTGEKKSSDFSSRLNVKRGGKLISKTLGKSTSPPSISAPPKAAVGTSKVRKDEVQRHKNSVHDMLRGSLKEKDDERLTSWNAPASVSSATQTTPDSRGGTILLDAEVAATLAHDKIAYLEKALATARDETAALKEELERVKQDAQASVEIYKYQASEAQHLATLEDATVQTESHNEALEQEEGQQDLVKQNHNLRFRLAELRDQLVAQSSTHAAQPLYSEVDWNALTLRLHETEKESHARLQQLLSLKSSISSLTRTDSQVSDSELAESFLQLANRVREWVVSNYRRTRMSFDGVPAATVQMLQSIKVNYTEIESADKLALYQAIVSRVLMQIFNEPLIVGMPAEGAYTGLRALSANAQLVGAEMLEWRRATLRMIEKSAPPATILTWKNQELESLASELEPIMMSISSTALTPHARLALIGLMGSAVDLQRTLCLQKEEYHVGFFDTLDGKQHCFDEHTMEPVNDLELALDESSESYPQREFAFCVFPCLEKSVSAMVNAVFKARVCCGVG